MAPLALLGATLTLFTGQTSRSQSPVPPPPPTPAPPSAPPAAPAVAAAPTPTLAVNPSPLAGITPQFPYAPAVAAPLLGRAPGRTAQWLGADGGSMAVFPDGRSTFWAFGDTHLGPAGATDRQHIAAAVINTIAVGWLNTDPATGRPRFDPTYYYRGDFSWDFQGPLFTTNNPSPYFIDPESYSDAPNNGPGFPPDPNYPPHPGVALTTEKLTVEQCSRFFVGKAIFHGPVLFVFLTRIRGGSPGIPLGSTLARIINACNPDGSPTDPRFWQVDYLTLSRSESPLIGAEALVAQGTHMLMFATFSRPVGMAPLNAVARIPVAQLLAAPDRANLAPLIEFYNSEGQWVCQQSATDPIPLGTAAKDLGIPGGGGFSLRYNATRQSWQAVFVDNLVDPDHVRLMRGPTPFGPWDAPEQVFRFPETDPANQPFNPYRLSNAYHAGIYSRALAEAPNATTIKCYQAYEIPAFSADPDRLVTLTYASNRASLLPLPVPAQSPAAVGYYPPGCTPGQPGFWLWDNNFYRIKGVSGLLPQPVPPAAPTGSSDRR